ncbi:hypothetical protein [Streptosporangium sp. NPDC048865]|uniref:hypothetical protein n=1 Tax=Streptosporangium sp. NPDC048865 TaxID=3155766 RepID=UPI0034472C65
MSTLPDGLEPIDPLTWRTIVVRCLLNPPVKHVALTAANYASRDGSDVRPGEKLLVKDTGLGARTVRDALAKLREVGLLYRVFEGAASGSAELADEYQLTYPDDLESRVAMWDPKRRKITKGGVEQAPPTPHTRKKRETVPAIDAGSQPVDNSEVPATDAGTSPPENRDEADTPEGLPAGNHRQLITGVPATATASTGRRCRPPSHAPSHSPSQHTYVSPYGAEVEGETPTRREPSAKNSSAPTFRQPPILAAVPDLGPDPADYDRARDLLTTLPDLGSALMAAAREQLPAGTPVAQVVIHAATLARRTA